MGCHQRAETSGLISFLICAVVGAVSMNLYLQFAPAIWQLTQRRFMVCFGHRGRVRCHLVHHRIRQQVTLAEPQTRLARADSSHVRNHRFVGGIRLDHLPVFVRPDRRGQ